MPPACEEKSTCHPWHGSDASRAPAAAAAAAAAADVIFESPGEPAIRMLEMSAEAQAAGLLPPDAFEQAASGSRLPVLTEEARRHVRLVIARCSVDYAAGSPLICPRPAAAHRQGGLLGARASDGGSLQAAELDVPAVPAGRGAGQVVGHQQGRRDARDHRSRGDSRATPRSTWGSTPAWSRTASSRTCRSCWRPRCTCSATAGGWSAASTRPRSARST
jgi:hypothetical protein